MEPAQANLSQVRALGQGSLTSLQSTGSLDSASSHGKLSSSSLIGSTLRGRVEPPGRRCQQQELLLGRVTLTTNTKHCKKGFGQMKNGWVPKVSM